MVIIFNNIIKDRFYPSSKTCNVCGYIKNDLELKDRFWNCPECNSILDRNINAAINILKIAKAIDEKTNE